MTKAPATSLQGGDQGSDKSAEGVTTGLLTCSQRKMAKGMHSIPHKTMVLFLATELGALMIAATFD